MNKLLYVIIGKNKNDVVFHDSFLGSMQDLNKDFVPDDDPLVTTWLNRYQELAHGSQPIDKIVLYLFNPVEEKMVLIHVLEYGGQNV